MYFKYGVLLLLIFLAFNSLIKCEKISRFTNKQLINPSITRFDQDFYDEIAEEIPIRKKKSQSEVNTKELTVNAKDTKKESAKNAISIDQKTSLISQLVNLVTSSLTNFTLNDAVAIGVFIVAVTGIKIVVIGILIWIWVAAEKYGGGGKGEHTGYAPSTSYGQPMAYGVPSQSYGAPIPSYGAPSSSYGAPLPSYGSPPSSYGAPSTSYAAPSSSYGAPSTSYAAPSSSYNAPSPSYGSPPASGYGTPSVSFTNSRSDPITPNLDLSNWNWMNRLMANSSNT